MLSITQPIQQWFGRWAARRAPRAQVVTLRHKSIYVLPTRQGLGFMLVLILLWVLGTNYENNLILGLAFLLVSLLLISVIHAFRNLSGLGLSIVRSHQGFAGEDVEFELLVRAAPRSGHESIRMGWGSASMCELELLNRSEARVRLSHRARVRGWLRPGRLLVETYFPLGFIRAWSWVYLDGQALIYPAPRSSMQPPLAHYTSHQGDQVSPENQEDFQGFRVYQTGAPQTHVAWKQYARGAGLHLKDYTGYQSEQVWLDWDQLRGLDTESRLSQLCYWALEFGKTSAEYGLRLPDLVVPMGRGSAHQARVLKALALFGLSEDQL